MSLTTSAHSLRSFALTARFARSTGLSALRAIEHYRGRVLNHGRACQRCDFFDGIFFGSSRESFSKKWPKRTFRSDAIELTFRQEVRFRQTFFQGGFGIKLLDHIRRTYIPLNLANMEIQKLKCVRNTAPDNKRVFNHAQP